MSDTNSLGHSMRRHMVGVALVAGLLVGGVGGWAVMTKFNGAVIASGQVVVKNNVKMVQHPTGGVVAELAVSDGQRVKAGDLLVRLDDTQTRTDLAVLTKALDELSARQARLEAERDGATEVVFPVDLLERMDQEDTARSVTGERQQFESRRQTRMSQKAQLSERVQQLGEEISGYRAQISSKGAQLEWVQKELVGIKELWLKKLIAYSRVTGLEREKERLNGERGQLKAQISQVRGKVLEIKLQIEQIDQDMRKEVTRELADIRAKKTELTQRETAARDQMERVDIRAPVSGFVHELKVHTIGGIVGQGQPIMLIVPEAEELAVQARVQPQDIDQIELGQPSIVRFSAYNQQTTPELNGAVSRISADISLDDQTGAPYFTLRIAVPEAEVTRLGKVPVVPGMPADVFVQTEARTVISFLTRPLRNQIARAFREQ